MAREKEPMLAGTLTIWAGGNQEVVEIFVEDALSGVRAFTLEIPHADLLRAVAASSGQKCMYSVGDTMLIGTTRESKRELVPFDCFQRERALGRRDERVTYALAPFEVDGWRGRSDDLWNPHKRIMMADGRVRRGDQGGTPHQEVVFVRFLRDGVPVELGS